MKCPSCASERCRRSHRRGIIDALATVAQLRPWRCLGCDERFYARHTSGNFSLRFEWHAHCPRCGNSDLTRVAGRWVKDQSMRWILRLAGAPAYRCDPCRYRFFSFRPLAHPESAAASVMARESASR
jgi:hypothetical protein